MTAAQRIHFFSDLWRPVCAVHGWDANDRKLRLDTLSEWLGREITTLDDVNNTDDFSEIKSRCLALFKPADLHAQVRQTGEVQKRLRLRWKIKVEQVKLLSAFMSGATQWQREGQAQAYLHAILRNRFKVDEDVEAADPVDIMSDKDLGQLLFTLARIIDSKRQKEGWTAAEMRRRAGLVAEPEAVPAENCPF